LIEKKSLKIKELEHVPIEKIDQPFRNMLACFAAPITMSFAVFTENSMQTLALSSASAP
jgi:hypothetical protein